MPAIAQLDQFDFHHRIESMRCPTLVMFGSPGCGSCKHLRMVLSSVQQRQPDWQFFEVDAQRDPGLAHEFEVFHLPTLYLFYNGEFHCELRAEARTATIAAATLAALRQPAEEAP